MDLSLLPTPANEYNKQRTGAHFTVRSASSPSYSLTHRSSGRIARSFSEEKRESTKGVRERERYGTHAGINDTNKQEDPITEYQAWTGSCYDVKGQEKETSGHKMSAKLNQNGTTDKTITEFGIKSENPTPASQERPEQRRNDLLSKNLSPDWSTSGDMSMWSSKQREDITRQAGELEERRTGVESTRDMVMSSIQAYNSGGASTVAQERSPVSHISQTMDRTSKGLSLPSRLKPQPALGSKFTATATSFGSKGGQSILERIEKLYGSAGFGKAEDYSKIRDFSTPGTTLSPPQQKSYDRAEGGKREGNDLVENEWEKRSNNCGEEFGKYSRLKRALEIPLNGGVQRQPQHFFIDETDFSKVFSPEEASEKDLSTNNKTTVLVSSDTSTGVPKKSPCVVSSPLSDDDKTPTNTPNHSPFLSPTTQPENVIPTAYRYDSTSVFTKSVKSPDPQSPPLPCPLATFSHSSLPEPISPDVNTAYQKGKKRVLDLDAWVAGLSSDIKVCNDTEDEDDDESTQKDEDSNYDSDSGESSVTITSSTSQSEHMSFCVNLSDLYNFAGVEYESENDSDDWRSTGQRSMSVSSDVSILSCVSLMPTEELDRLLEDVRNLGDNTRQDYDDVQVVVLHKEIGVGLGFSVAGGMDQNKPVTVHKVFHLGVAAQEGSIREGDQVLSINGTALCGCTHWEAVRVLRRAKTREMGVVVLKRGDVNSAFTRGVQESNQGPTQTQSIETDQCVCVHLEKNSRDLGFSLEGGVGSSLGNRPLTVQKIFQGGPVDKVFPGDEVVEIEGMSMVAMSRLEAWTFIRRLPPGPVDIVLRRPLKHLET
uniref:PDZ domain-containing protein n=1 Tax=Monopterus albus TaxID=43700 RepID=A0A3Q3IMB4_MONAL